MTSRRRTKLDYETLIQLARSRRVKVIEAEGLGDSSGIGFNKSKREWIIINSSLPIEERTRALGFLLENYPGKLRPARSNTGDMPLSVGETHFQLLRCPRRKTG